MKNQPLTVCRICGTSISPSLDYLELKACPLTDDFIEKDSERIEFLQDVRIIRCQYCGTVQNPENFDYSSYYQTYEYSSASSQFTKNFMAAYAQVCSDLFASIHRRNPSLILEPGSGDGQQLGIFLKSGARVLGIEPSSSLAAQARLIGVETDVALFDLNYVNHSLTNSVDVCLSSYTLDHCPDPLSYLLKANEVLIHNGIIAFEVHDLSRIYQAAEYCLFEHEHTIYLDRENAQSMLESCGFELISCNPIPPSSCRANSLILIGKKVNSVSHSFHDAISNKRETYQMTLKSLAIKINKLTQDLDDWVNCYNGPIVGYGAGGRGVMTLAQMKSHIRFSAILDMNFGGRSVYTPKTRIPIYGPALFKQFAHARVLVFSFGYYDEIKRALCELGFNESNIFSLKQFMPS